MEFEELTKAAILLIISSEFFFLFWMLVFIVYHKAFSSSQPRCRTLNVVHIEYRCADGRFLMSSRGMAVSNTRYLSSSETRVHAGIRGFKLHLSEST
jgi:hypothetical protein